MVRMMKVKGEAIWIMCLLFILGGVIASLTTYIGITYLGLSETNPFMAEMFAKYGMVNALILANLVELAIGLGVAILGTHPRTWERYSLPMLIDLAIFATITLTDALGNIIVVLEVIVK